MNYTTTYYIELKLLELQIGELKSGWQFLFYPHPRFYDSNKRGINRFLKLHKHEIYKSQFSDISNSFERTKVNVDDFWEVIEDNKTGLDIKSFYGYPDCLKYYVEDEESYKLFLDRQLLSRKELVIFRRLPTLKKELEQSLNTEIIIDNLRWKNSYI